VPILRWVVFPCDVWVQLLRFGGECARPSVACQQALENLCSWVLLLIDRRRKREAAKEAAREKERKLLAAAGRNPDVRLEPCVLLVAVLRSLTGCDSSCCGCLRCCASFVLAAVCVCLSVPRFCCINASHRS
jgi:hypothetical protein